jgi:hypothetical protein
MLVNGAMVPLTDIKVALEKLESWAGNLEKVWLAQDADGDVAIFCNAPRNGGEEHYPQIWYINHPDIENKQYGHSLIVGKYNVSAWRYSSTVLRKEMLAHIRNL